MAGNKIDENGYIKSYYTEIDFEGRYLFYTDYSPDYFDFTVTTELVFGKTDRELGWGDANVQNMRDLVLKGRQHIFTKAYSTFYLRQGAGERERLLTTFNIGVPDDCGGIGFWSDIGGLEDLLIDDLDLMTVRNKKFSALVDDPALSWSV